MEQGSGRRKLSRDSDGTPAGNVVSKMCSPQRPLRLYAVHDFVIPDSENQEVQALLNPPPHHTWRSRILHTVVIQEARASRYALAQLGALQAKKLVGEPGERT